MKRKKEQLPLPLRLVKDFEQSFPHCWEWSDYMRGGRGKNLPEWTDLCYLPLAAAQAVMLEKYDKHDLNYSAVFAALASWRQYKEIYSFSPELTETLYSQSGDDITVPNEILFGMPYPCVFISTGENEGFFCFFEQDMHTMGLELRFCEVSRNGAKISIEHRWLHLGENYTISDGINEGVELSLKNMPTKLSKNECEYLRKALYENISQKIQLVLYICADNAEIEENPEQKSITRKPPKNSKPKDTFREIRSWDVGVRFSKAIRKAAEKSNMDANPETSEPTETAEQQAPENPSNRKSPRPHARRGHWHHFWIGSSKDNSRRLILKWIAPIFVGNPEKSITTINIVE